VLLRHNGKPRARRKLLYDGRTEAPLLHAVLDLSLHL
jgi:hypothetical protein